VSLHPRRRTVWAHWPTTVWLTVVWVLLWGDLSLGNVLAGLALAMVVTVLLPLPPIGWGGRLRPLGIARLAAVFARDVAVASAQVAAQAFRREPPHGAVIGVRLRASSDLYLTMTAELCSLVPGSVVVEAHRLTGTLYLHILDVGVAGGIEAARQAVLDQEERVLQAFASDAELAAAGLDAPRGVPRPGTGVPT